MANLVTSELLLPILNRSLQFAMGDLQDFAGRADFDQLMSLPFGEGHTWGAYQKDWAQGIVDFPTIQSVPQSRINGALGAFSSQTNRIYIAEELLKSDEIESKRAAAILLEEYGHYLDSKINSTDSAGDEGELFSNLVRGIALTPEQLVQLKTKVDTTTAIVDGQLLQIEQASLSGSGGEGGTNESLKLDPLPPGQTKRNVTLTYFYEHYSIPDKFEVRYGSKTLVTTKTLVSGSKGGTQEFEQIQGQDIVNVIVTAPRQGTAWEFSVSTEESPDIKFNGLVGDVTKLNFTSQLKLKSLPNSSKGKLITYTGENAAVGQTYKNLYYVPNVNGAIAIYGQEKQHPGLGKVTFDVEDKNKLITAEIDVTDGFSTSGENMVTFGGEKLKIYSQQQRLAYLGFPGSNGSPLTVNGVADAGTKWAMSLVEAVIKNKNVIKNKKSTGLQALSKEATDFINGRNAPQWNEVPRSGGEGWTNVDTDNFRWGTNWAIEVIQEAGRLNTSGFNIGINDVSLRMGGYTPQHTSHQAGLDIDVQLQPPGGPWYQIGKVVQNLNNGSHFWQSVANAVPDDNIKTAQQARQGVAVGGNFTTGYTEKVGKVNNGWRIDQTINNLYSHRNSADAYNIAINQLTASTSFDDDFNQLIPLRADRTAAIEQIDAFLRVGTTQAGASVQGVIYNDPIATRILRERHGQANISAVVTHGNHFHVDIRPPKNITTQGGMKTNFVETRTSVGNALNVATSENLTPMPNKNQDLANIIDLGTLEGKRPLKGFINNSAPEVTYRFVIDDLSNKDSQENDTIVFSTTRNFSSLLSNLNGDIDLELIQDYNDDLIREDYEVIASSNNPGSANEAISMSGLEGGVYYLRVIQKNGETNYTLDLTVPPLPVPKDDAGNTAKKAKDLKTITTHIQQSDFIGQVDADDYYRFTISSIRDVTIDITGLSDGDLYAELGQDRNKNGILDFDEVIAGSDEEGNNSERISRTGCGIGDYILHLGRNSGNTEYTLNLATKLSDIPQDKAGNKPETSLDFGTLKPSMQQGFVGNVDPIDYYRFTLAEPSGIHLELRGLSADADIELSKDKNADNLISSDEVIASSDNIDNQDEQINIPALPAGNYFIKVAQYQDDTPYNLSITPLKASGPDLLVTVSPVNTPLIVGGAVRYTINVKNIGASAASDVVITDNLPQQNVLNVIGVSSKGDVSISTDDSILAEIGTLDVNETAQVMISGDLIGSGRMRSLIQSSSSDQDFDLENNSVIQRFNVATSGIQPTDLELTLTADKKKATVNDFVTFRITLANKGPGAATSIRVKDVLPQGLLFVSADPQQGSYDSTTGIWDAGNVAKDNDGFIDIIAKVSSDAFFTNTAEVIAFNEKDPDSVPNNHKPKEDDQASITIDARPNITLKASATSLTEDGTDNLVYTFSRTGSTSNPLKVNYTIGGTAKLGTDYAFIAAKPATKSVSFIAGSATATLTVDPKADSTIETDETVALTLAAGSGYSIGTTGAVVGKIINDDVSSSISYTMKAFERTLLLVGKLPINGIGNDLDNMIKGNNNNNQLTGRLGADLLTGNGTRDSDSFIYNSLNESLLGGGTSYDTIMDFNNKDRIIAPLAVEKKTISSYLGSVMNLSSTSIASLLKPNSFSAHSVAAFRVAGQSGTFISMNDAQPGFQPESDAILFLKNYTLNTTNTIVFA